MTLVLNIPIDLFSVMPQTLKGKFRPKNPEKYKGNAGNIIYRSSWEQKFMDWCDRTEEVLAWQSEEKQIPYFDPVAKKHRRYYPDFLIKYKKHDGTIMTEMVEVKPLKQVKGPNRQPKKRTRGWLNEVNTYVTNTSKWRAAENYCEDRGWKFRLLTEKNINDWQLL